ncbi:MAG: hypothetical protein ACE5D3_02840 [Candidatus Binatia bacterium]
MKTLSVESHRFLFKFTSVFGDHYRVHLERDAVEGTAFTIEYRAATDYVAW